MSGRNGAGVTPLQTVLDRLPQAKRQGSDWIAHCTVPSHGQQRGDRNPSLSVAEGDDGRALLKCHAGCTTEDIVGALDLKVADLFPEKPSSNGNHSGAGLGRIVATYDYRDEAGELQYQVVRHDPKDFRQRRPDGNGGWEYNVRNTRKVLFRLPELVAVDPETPVFIVEGEKDALMLVGLGLVATTNAGGAGKWRPEYTESLRGRHLVLLPDNDMPGSNHAQHVARALVETAASIKVIELPGISQAGDASDWVAAGGTRDELIRLVAEAPEWAEAPRVVHEVDPSLQTIIVHNRPMRDVTAEALEALRTRNDPPLLFERGGQLCRVRRDENDRPVIEMVSEGILRGVLERSANYVIVTSEGVTKPVAPPLHIVRDLAAVPGWGLPPLEAIVETPVLRPDGSVLGRPGYDPQTRLYYSPAPGLVVPPVPENPTGAQTTAALALITELIADFPFVDDASYANALALMLTPIVRPAIQGSVPMAMIDAPAKGTGKTLLAEAVSIIATGKAESMGAPRREEEWQKLVTAALAAGSTFIIIDNMRDTVRSGVLERVLTSTEVMDRVLGTSRMVHLPQRATWVGTANNVDLSGDLSRRCYWIRIDAKTACPWMGRTFAHPDLLAWVRAHRGELIAALLTLARSWYAAGCPKAPTPILGKFERWCEVVGGILAHAGDQNFLGNLDEMYGAMDETNAQWEGFLRAWWERYGAETRTVFQLVVEMVLENEGENGINAAKNLRVSLPDELLDALAVVGDKRSQNAFSRKLGKALKRKKDVRYGSEGLHLERVGEDSHRGSITWKVVPDAGFAGLLYPEVHARGENV